jgi:hypothetical protein
MAERRCPKVRRSYEFRVRRASKHEKRVLSQAREKICLKHEHKAKEERVREREREDKWKDYDLVVLVKM